MADIVQATFGKCARYELRYIVGNRLSKEDIDDIRMYLEEKRASRKAGAQKAAATKKEKQAELQEDVMYNNTAVEPRFWRYLAKHHVNDQEFAILSYSVEKTVTFTDHGPYYTKWEVEGARISEIVLDEAGKGYIEFEETGVRTYHRNDLEQVEPVRIPLSYGATSRWGGFLAGGTLATGNFEKTSNLGWTEGCCTDWTMSIKWKGCPECIMQGKVENCSCKIIEKI